MCVYNPLFELPFPPVINLMWDQSIPASGTLGRCAKLLLAAPLLLHLFLLWECKSGGVHQSPSPLPPQQLYQIQQVTMPAGQDLTQPMFIQSTSQTADGQVTAQVSAD